MNNATIENGLLFLQNAANETFSQYIPANPTDSNDTVAATLGFLSNSTQAYYAANLASSPDQALINTTYAEVVDAVAQYALAVWNSIMDTYGFVPSEDALASTTDNVTIENFATVQTQAALNTASLIFVYFYVATGFTLILTGFLGIINVRSYTVWSWVRFATHIMFGLAMALLSLLSRGDGTSALNISSTAWPLPIVAMVVLVVLAIHHVSWENHEAEEKTGEKQYHFLPRWRPNRHGSA